MGQYIEEKHLTLVCRIKGWVVTVVISTLKVRADINCKASTFYLKRLHLKKKKTKNILKHT